MIGSIARLGALGLALLSVAPASATVLFFDDFDAGASADWGNQRGDWRDTGGQYDATNPNNNPVTYSDVTTLPSLTDFTVDVDVNDLNDGGIWLRSSFNTGVINGVLLVTGGKGGSYGGLYWHIVQDNLFSGILNEFEYPNLQDSDSHLTVVVSGNTYAAFIGVTLVTSLTTPVFSSGAAGLYDFSPTSGVSDPRGQTFDNFQISADVVAVPEPSAMVVLGLGLAGLAMARGRRR